MPELQHHALAGTADTGRPPIAEGLRARKRRADGVGLVPVQIICVAVEAGVSLGWHRWVGDAGRVLAIDRFGASAPAAGVFAELGLTVERVTTAAAELLDGRG